MRMHTETWNMARKLKIMENEKHPLDDLKNDEITKKRVPWHTLTLPRRLRNGTIHGPDCFSHYK